MKIIAHTVKSQTLFSILSLNATTPKRFMLKLLIGLMTFNAKFNCAFSPTSHELLFGTDLNTSRSNELRLDYCLLFAKYYLYYPKMYYKACNITEFVLKLEQKLLFESRLKVPL